MCRFSVIVRTKDRPLLLKRSLQSLLNQTYKNFEVVVINNGGNFIETQEICELFSQEISINLISTDKPYYMEHATNLGIKNCENEWIILLDDDDTWDRNLLNDFKIDIGRNPNVNCFACWTRIIYEEIENDCIKYCGEEILNDQFYELNKYNFFRRNYITTNSFCFNKKIIETVGYYNSNLPVLGDWEFNIRVALIYKIVVIPKVLANYHKRKNQVLPNSAYKLHRENQLVVRKAVFIKLLKDMYFFDAIYVGVLLIKDMISLIRFKLTN